MGQGLSTKSNEIVLGLGQDQWTSILKFITDPDDKWACYHVCELWRLILEPNKKNWQWALVLPHVADYLKLLPYNYYGGGVLSRCRYLWRARLVSKAWNNAIQDYAEKQSESWNRNPDMFVYSFSYVEELNYFAKKFADVPNDANPFIGKAVHFSSVSTNNADDNEMDENEAKEGNEDDGRIRQYGRWTYRQHTQLPMKRVINFLQKFGKYLSFVSFSETRARGHDLGRTLNFCVAVQRNLSSTPHLKHLRIMSAANDRTGGFRNVSNLEADEEDGSDQELSSDEEGFEEENPAMEGVAQEGNEVLPIPIPLSEQVRQYFEENPLPTLPQLKELTLGYMHTMEDLIFDKYAPQLTDFSLEAPQQLTLDQFGKFQMLNGLCLNKVKWNDRLERLNLLQSPIRRIRISMDTYHNYNHEGYRWWHVDTFLKGVKHLPLETVEFDTDYAIITEYGNIDIAELNLPTVKKVKFLGRYSMIVSFNFLQRFPNLKEIEVDCSNGGNGLKSRPPYNNVPETVKLHKYLYEEAKEKNIYKKSNVWTLIPSLERILVKWATYLRNVVTKKRVYTKREYNEYFK